MRGQFFETVPRFKLVLLWSFFMFLLVIWNPIECRIWSFWTKVYLMWAICLNVISEETKSNYALITWEFGAWKYVQVLRKSGAVQFGSQIFIEYILESYTDLTRRSHTEEEEYLPYVSFIEMCSYSFFISYP